MQISSGLSKIAAISLTNDFLSESHSRLRNNISLNQNDQPTIGKNLVDDSFVDTSLVVSSVLLSL